MPLTAGAILLTLLVASAAAAPEAEAKTRGCDRPAGDPEQAAVLQYCPRKTPQKREADNRAAAVIPGADGPSSGAPGPAGDTKTLPFVEYPSSDGLSWIVWLLLAALGLIAARQLYRRYLAGRIGGRRGPRLPTQGSAN